MATRLDLCLGCGIRTAVGDRRSLRSTLSLRRVIPVWAELAEITAKENGMPNLLVAQDCENGFMCRKCFTAFNRFSDLKLLLIDNIKNSLLKRVEQCHGYGAGPPGCSGLHVGEKRSAPSTVDPPASKHRRLEGHPGVARQLQFIPPATQSSPAVAVTIGYTKSRPRSIILTPSRKKIGRILARGSKVSMIKEFLGDETMRKIVVSQVGYLLRREIRVLCSDKFGSMMKKQSVLKYSCDEVIKEMENGAPNLLEILQICTRFQRRKRDCSRKSSTAQLPLLKKRQNSTIAMCASMLCKYRCPSMSLLQKIISLVLYASSCSKMVFKRLQRLNICTSHQTTLNTVDVLGKDYDTKLKQWMSEMTEKTYSSSHIQSYESGLDMPLNLDDSVQYQEESQLSVFSDFSFSEPLTSTPVNEQQHCAGLLPDASPLAPSFSLVDESSSIEQSDLSVPAFTNSSQENERPVNIQPSQCHGVKLVGDNVDYTVSPTITRSDRQCQTLNYFQMYAVKDRIDISCLSEEPPLVNPEAPLQELLPADEDNIALLSNFTILVSRVLVENIPFFSKHFSDIVVQHIPHMYSSELSAKSEIVPLGVLPKCENKYEDMIAIMEHAHQYVPTTSRNIEICLPATEEKMSLVATDFHKLLFGGDQLTAKRARGSQRIRCNSIEPSEQICGLVPTSEDWHTKVCLLSVIWKRLYSTVSASDFATLSQLRNLLKRRDVGTNAKKNFDACHDFFMLVLTGHILSASLEFMGMDSVHDTPNEILFPSYLKNQSKEARKEVLHQVVSLIVDSYVDISTIKYQARDADGYQTQNDTEVTSKCFIDEDDDKEVESEQDEADNLANGDDVYRYACELLSLGLLYSEYSDAIKEGDGQRIFRCFKYMLPIFKASGRVNYACELFCTLAQHRFILSPRLAHQLQWSRFVNTHGKKGKNIPCDLHMEHMNRIVKNGIRGLGANKAENAMIRIGKCVDSISNVLALYDDEHGISSPLGHHTIASQQKDLDLIMRQLNTCVNPFTKKPGRRHSNIRIPKTMLLRALDGRKFSVWLSEKWHCLLAGLI